MDVTPNEVKEAVEALRKSVDQYGQESAQTKAISEKVEKTLLAHDEHNAKIVADMLAEQKKSLELEERVKGFELELAKKQVSGKNYKDGLEYKAINNLVKFGEKGLEVEQFKTLRMDTGTSGGYLTTTEMDNQLLKQVTEISPVRQVSRVKTTSKKTLEIPIRTTIPVATYEGEAGAGNESQSVYANEQLTAYRLTVTIPFTMDLLMDSQFDLMSEINADVAEAFAFGEGNKFVLGTGAKQPEGFLVNPAVIAATSTSGTGGAISIDDLFTLTGALKVGYNPIFAFNRKTLAYIRTLKDGAGSYAWQESLVPNAPATIAGSPYVVMQDMPDIAASSKSVIYADFLRGYTITDRTGMTMIRDETSGKKNAIVELTFHRWNTGQVVLPEAFALLTTKAT